MKKLVLLAVLLPQLLFAMDRQTPGEYRARRQALASKLGAGVALLFAPMEAEGPNDLYGYRQGDNFFYLSGWTEPGAAVLVAPATEATAQAPARPYTEILFLPARNLAQEKWTGVKLGADNPDAPKITGFDRVEVLDRLHEEITRLLPSRRATVYTDSTGSAGPGYAAPVEWLKRANAFPLGTSFQEVGTLLASLRTFKDPGEIERIRKATDASIAAHLAAMHAMKPGTTEREIAALLQYEWGKRGCERPAYSTIVGSGFNSTVLHYSDDSGTIQAGDTVVIDAAGEYSMYASDITRTLPASGKFTARQREIYDIVLGAQNAAIAAFQAGKSRLRPGATDSLYQVAFDYINTHGKDLHGEPLGKYFIHGLSHYVGLNVHDDNDYDLALAPGMVFTIEPGIYIPEEKLGVRIEDIVYVDANGKLVNLTAGLPHTADEVEREMSAR